MGRINPLRTEQPEFQVVTTSDSRTVFEIDLDAIMGDYLNQEED